MMELKIEIQPNLQMMYCVDERQHEIVPLAQAASLFFLDYYRLAALAACAT